MDLDLGSILGQTSAFASQTDQAQQQLGQIITQGNQTIQQKTQLDNDAASAASLKVQADLTEKLRQEQMAKTIAARFGTDASQPGWYIGQMGDKIQEAQAGLDAASQKIAAKNSINFLTNPLGWIAAKMTVNNDIQEYNMYARQKNNAEDTAQELERMSQQSTITNNALSATITPAYISAMKTLGAYQYNADALNTQLQGARWNMEGVLQSTNLAKDKLGALYQGNSAIMQMKMYQTEQARLDLQRQEFDLRKVQFQDKQQEDAFTLNTIKQGYFVQSGKQMDDSTAKNALLLFRAKQPDIVSMFQSGLDTAMSGGKPVFSLSPYQTGNLIARGKIQNMSPAMEQAAAKFPEWQRQFETPAVQQAYPHDPKDPLGREKAFNSFVQDKVKQETSSVAPGTTFAPAPLDKVASLHPELGNLPVWKQVLEPASKTGVNVSDPNTALGLVLAGMKAGKISYADATDLASLYQGAMEVKNQTMNFHAFGLPAIRTYNAPVNIPGSFGATVVNMTDPQKLATALNRAEALRMFGGSGNITAPRFADMPGQ